MGACCWPCLPTAAAGAELSRPPRPPRHATPSAAGTGTSRGRGARSHHQAPVCTDTHPPEKSPRLCVRAHTHTAPPCPGCSTPILCYGGSDAFLPQITKIQGSYPNFPMAMQWLGWASEHSGDGATISRDFTMELLWAGGRGASHLKRCSEHPVLV